MKTILYILLTIFGATSALAGEMTLGKWLEINEPVVKRYLTSLTLEQVGRKLKGVKLSDGKMELKGHIYLGNSSDPKKGVHIYKFRYLYRGAKYESYYIWIDKGFPNHEIPHCSGTWLEPGGISVLSGDVYPHSKILADGGLVVTHCVLSNKGP